MGLSPHTTTLDRTFVSLQRERLDLTCTVDKLPYSQIDYQAGNRIKIRLMTHKLQQLTFEIYTQCCNNLIVFFNRKWTNKLDQFLNNHPFTVV